MTAAIFLLFWISVGTLIWVYVLYPVLALVWGRLRPVRLAPGPAVPSLVTVGLAVHNGERELEERIANIVSDPLPFALDVIIASDGSTDGTPQIARRIAAADSRIRLLELPRVGQSVAQSRIFASARGEIVVLTDVETRFAPGCLAALVAPLADPRVGCVTGVLSWSHERRTPTARDEGLYWRYEQRVRLWESRAGWLSAATGALLAARTSVFRPAAPHSSLDQMLPLFCREAGKFVVIAPSALASDKGTATPGEQFASRVRIATQGIEANLRMSAHLAPWRHPGTFLALWSHKILRWATPFLATFAGLAGAGLWWSGHGVAYASVGAVAVVVATLALVGYVGMRSRRRIPLTGFPLTFVAVNLAFASAWLNVVLRRRVRAWPSV